MQSDDHFGAAHLAPPLNSLPANSLLWWRWLVVVTSGVMILGTTMVLAPDLIQKICSLLLYSSVDQITQFGASASNHIALTHAIIGALMLGWGTTLLLLVLGPFRRGSREAWMTLLISVLAWFIPDTAFSLWAGFWQNAILNLLTVTLLVIPLAATYRNFRGTHA